MPLVLHSGHEIHVDLLVTPVQEPGSVYDLSKKYQDWSGYLHAAIEPDAPHGEWNTFDLYVVGDQASYLRIPIYTAQLLADVAIKVGYKVEGIELWRTRWSSATKQNIDENVLILKRP